MALLDEPGHGGPNTSAPTPSSIATPPAGMPPFRPSREACLDVGEADGHKT